MIKPLQPGFRPWENHTTALRARKCIPPLVAGATTFPPQFGGAAKGKRLNGQARRLTSPHCGGPMQDLHSGTIKLRYAVSDL